MTIKDSVAVLDPKSAAKPGRREAVGAEVPVTVHASRTTQGLGKNLPSVHEDTKTVIVLQQGAVVRLTASLTTGETVVLTNRITGADVLCRVGNVKSQPGIQHYVDLEFIQRAPGFWGDTGTSQSAPVQEVPAPQPAAVAPPPPAPVAAPPLAVTPLPVPPRAPVSVAAPPPVPTPIPMPIPTPVLTVPAPLPEPPAAPAVDLATPPAIETLQPAPLAEPVVAPWKASAGSPVTPINRGSNDSSFGSIGAQSIGTTSRGSQKNLLTAAAAVLLVLGGAAGGYWFYSQSAVASSPALQQTENVSPAQPTAALTGISSPASGLTPTTLSTSAQPPADIIVESRPVLEASTSRIEPPVTSARTPAVRRNNVVIGQMKAPKAKSTSRIDANEPPPVMMSAVNLGDPGAVNTLLVGEAVGPAPPPGSLKPAVGGQLVPPQVITSTAAVYPPTARMSNVQGVVVLDVLVDETGKVVETKVIAGPQPLLAAAQDSVRNWKYKPAQLNGKPISVHTKVSVRFNLH